jgi:hypothetical protein
VAPRDDIRFIEEVLGNSIKLFDRNHTAKVIPLLPSNEEKLVVAHLRRIA